MALIKCPKCGKEFSDRAQACPQCSTPKEEVLRLIAEKEAAEAVERERLRKEREAKEAEEARIRAEKRAEWWKKNKRWIISCIVLFLVSFTSYVIYVNRDTVVASNAKGISILRFRKTTHVIIPNSVTSIGDYAFAYCTGLTSVTIPNSVTSIGYRAFWNCAGLTSVTIPNSVTSIGDDAFDNCSGLTSIEIPNSVTSIGVRAFEYCSGLTSITIPNSVTSIEVQAFYKCTGLTSVTIGNSVTSIGLYAFAYCTGLTSVTIPNSVTSIGDDAFEGCTSLVIQIPERFRGEVNLSDCKEVIYISSKSWLYGTWKCRTPYGTIKVILQEDGRMYDSVNEGWYKYTIEGDRIIEQCNGYISTYNIDRANERFDCGEPGVWFYKE